MFLSVPLGLMMLHLFFGVSMTLIAIFLILLVLVQRGRGGGLAGAFGGMGGQSAFGTKAGDTFTRVTIVVSLIWILLCVASVKLLSYRQDIAVRGRTTPGPTTEFPGTIPPSTPSPDGDGGLGGAGADEAETSSGAAEIDPANADTNPATELGAPANADGGEATSETAPSTETP